MAITIIGANTDQPEALPEADVSLPLPQTVPANTPALDDEHLQNLLKHEDALVRAFAVEQVAHRGGDTLKWLVPMIDDEDPVVAADAMSVVGKEKVAEAADALGDPV